MTAMVDWVPVLAPPTLAARFMREVAAHLELQGGDDGPRDWGAASDAERSRFFGDVAADQWRLLVHLARSELPVPASELAGSLGIEVSDVAGIVGPLNKRAKRAGWVSPVRPQTFWRGRGGEKGLQLHSALGPWVKDRDDRMEGSR